MPVPKKRRSHARTRVYHAAWKAGEKQTNVCTQCGAPVISHRVCPACGYYKGKKVMVTKQEKASIKKARKQDSAK